MARTKENKNIPRIKIQNILTRLHVRRDQLILNIINYKECDNFEGAMISDIKKRQFDLFITSIEEVLLKK